MTTSGWCWVVLGLFWDPPFFPKFGMPQKISQGLRQGAYTMRPNKIMAQIKDFLTGRWRWARRIGDGSNPENQLIGNLPYYFQSFTWLPTATGRICEKYTRKILKAHPWKMMVGKTKGQFSGAMLNFRGVQLPKQHKPRTKRTLSHTRLKSK